MPATRLWPSARCRSVNIAPTNDSEYRSYRTRPTNVWADEPYAGSFGVGELAPPTVVVRVHHADGGVAGLAGQLRAVARVDDGAGVHQVDRPAELEDLRAFQKERPQLGEEQVEALVHLDLWPVRFDLREVGVERHVRGQVGGDAVLDVDPALGLYVAVGEAAGSGCRASRSGTR